MIKHLKTITSGFLAGILISLGGFVSTYIRANLTNSLVISAILFSFGLLTICIFSFSLFTGKIAYVIEKRSLSYIIDLLEMLLGNIISCILMGCITRLLRVFPSMENTLISMCEAKNNDTWYSLFFLAFFCGILVYLAVEIFKSNTHYFTRTIGLIFSVSIFVILGFEHVIADIYYYSASFMWSLLSLRNILIILVGNSLGALAFHHLKLFALKNNE